MIKIIRIREACEKETFLMRTFTELECRQARGSTSVLADNFATKEAMAESFGTGFRTFMPGDIEVPRDELEEPHIVLYRGAKEIAKSMGMSRIHVSITDTSEYALGLAVRRGERQMRVLMSGSQMRKINRYTMEEIGIPSIVLMEWATMAVVNQVEQRCTRAGHIWVVCGTGNNRADGIVVDRMLHLKGYRASILLYEDTRRGTAEYHQQLTIVETLTMLVIEYHNFIPSPCDAIVDGIFGVGLGREVEGEYREAMEILESRHAREVIAIDISPGFHSNAGQIMGIELKAAVTMTFGYEKLGSVLYSEKAYHGNVVVADIGFPEVSYETCGGIRYFTYEAEDMKRRPVRPAGANRGAFGRVLVVAGSRNMSGAAYLSTLAAYRMGAGLVKIPMMGENWRIFQTRLPEAILETYGIEDGKISESQIAKAYGWAAVIVLGPGIDRELYVEQLAKNVLMQAYVPIIINTDELSAIAAHPELAQYYTKNIIITLHVGEMSGLTGQSIESIEAAPVDTALRYSGLRGITYVLKDAVSVITGKEGQVYLSIGGNSAVAKTGAGDVLAEAIAGLLAQGEENQEVTILGVYLRGAAGDRYLDRLGARGLLAGDITNELGMI